MLNTLRAWLNGSREYFSGVALFSQLSDNAALVALFKKGPTPYTSKRLPEELLEICYQLKSKNETNSDRHSNRITDGSGGNRTTMSVGSTRSKNSTTNEHQVHNNETATKRTAGEVNGTEEPPENQEMYDACKLRADKQYKQTMNERAHLFALAKEDDYEDINTTDKVAQRAKMALSVIQGYQVTSFLYEQADYVKEHGRLPGDDTVQAAEEYEALADTLVKPTLDALRKNVNKLKKREAIPERLALIQKHEANITKLEARWLLLKPGQ